MFGLSFIYCSVSFGTGRTYYYRTSSKKIKSGDRVIVPVTAGKWKIGMVVSVNKYSRDKVPYPLNKTKGIIAKAGRGSEKKVKRNNKYIDNSKYPPLNISRKSIYTANGYVSVIMTSAERKAIKKQYRNFKTPIIENYPPATSWEVKHRPKEIDDLRWVDNIELNRMNSD